LQIPFVEFLNPRHRQKQNVLLPNHPPCKAPGPERVVGLPKFIPVCLKKGWGNIFLFLRHTRYSVSTHLLCLDDWNLSYSTALECGKLVD